MKRIFPSLRGWAVLALALICPGTPAQSLQGFEVLGEDDTYASDGYMDLWGYARAGREYLLVTTFYGLSIIDLADPTYPQELFFIEAGASAWHDVKVYKDYAYHVTDVEGPTLGLQIIKLSELPDTAYVVNAISNANLGKVHNIAIDSVAQLLILVGSRNDGNPVGVYSLANPEEPELLSSIPTRSHDMASQDGFLYIATSYGLSFQVYDISNPLSPSFISEFVAGNDPGYAHNIYPTPDNKYLITSEETSGKTIKIWDMQNKNQIHMVNEWIGDPNWIAHQGLIYGDRMLIAHYGAGCWLVDISDPLNLRDIAHHTPIDYATDYLYAGTFGAVMLPSGLIAHAGGDGGYWILKVEDNNTPVLRSTPNHYQETAPQLFWGQADYNIPGILKSGQAYTIKGQGLPFIGADLGQVRDRKAD